MKLCFNKIILFKKSITSDNFSLNIDIFINTLYVMKCFEFYLMTLF